MNCPDCKDGFYYPLVGPREKCQTCSDSEINSSLIPLMSETALMKQLKNKLDNIQAQDRTRRASRGSGPNPQNISRQQAKNENFAKAYGHPTATEANDAKLPQTEEERNAILERIGVSFDGVSDSFPIEHKTTDWSKYTPDYLQSRIGVLYQKSLSDESDQDPAIIRLVVSEFLQLSEFDARSFLFGKKEFDLADMDDFTSYSQTRHLHTKKYLQKKTLEENGFSPTL